MKRIFPASAFAAAMALWVLATPAFALDPPAKGGSGGGGAVARGSGGGSSGGRTAPAGGRSAGGAARAPAPSGGSGRSQGGYSGRSAPREDGAGATRGGGRAVERGATGTPTGAQAVPRGASGATRGAGGTAVGRTGSVEAAPPRSRTRDGREPVGTAVPRTAGPKRDGGGGGTIFLPGYYGFYPWDFGYGFGYGYGYGYDGGYDGGYYDPWYGGDPYYPQVETRRDEGALRLKIKPREAQVQVDGYYVGIVDDFDGVFQRLHVDAGPHRIDVHATGYEPLTFDVQIAPDHTTTYKGELKKLP